MNHQPKTATLRAWIAPLLGALALVAASCAPAAAPPAPAAPAAPAPSAPQPTRAAASPTPAVRAPAQVDKLVIALPFPGHNTFDPILETSDRKFDIEYIYEYVVGTAADGKLTTNTGLASEWSQSADSKSWTFKLKPGSKFSNGDEVTAEDAKFSLDRLVTDKRAVTTYVSLFKAMVDKIEVKDQYTYTVSTKGTQALLPHFLSPLSIGIEGTVVSKKYFDKVGDKEFAAKPVGSGPYKVVSNDPGQRFEMESVGKHRMMANPPAKRLVFTNVKEPTTRVALLRTKEADIASIPLVSKKEVQQAGIRTFSKPEDFFSSIHIHAQDPKSPVSNKLVRQAMTYALDRKTILQTLYQNEGALTDNHATRISFEWVQDLPLREYSQDKAKALLKEAGYPNGFDLTFLAYVRNPADSMEVIEAIASMWTAVGIKTKVEPIDYAVFRDRWSKGQTAGGVDIITHATGFSQTALFNTIHHSKGLLALTKDPELDKLIEAAAKAPNEAEIRKAGAALQRYTFDQQYEITIALINTVYGTSPKIATWTPSILPNSMDLGRLTVNP